MTAAFADVNKTLEASNPGLSITPQPGSSTALAKKIKDEGAPADVFASADEKNMQSLVDDKLVQGTPQVFARNVLQIGVQPGNPKNIMNLADTEKAGVKLVLAAPDVPVGKYARQAYANAGLPAPKPVSNELDATATIAKLTSGEADAVVVYVTDVKTAGAKAEGVDIPDERERDRRRTRSPR